MFLGHLPRISSFILPPSSFSSHAPLRRSFLARLDPSIDRRGQSAGLAGGRKPDALRGLRSDGRQHARRPLDGRDDFASLSARRTSADCPGRRRDRHDRRSERQERGAELALPRGLGLQCRGARSADAPFSRFRRFAAGHPGEQLRLDEPLQLSRFSARHRQEFSGQRDVGQRLGQEPLGADRQRTELYRVQLHAAASL